MFFNDRQPEIAFLQFLAIAGGSQHALNRLHLFPGVMGCSLMCEREGMQFANGLPIAVREPSNGYVHGLSDLMQVTVGSGPIDIRSIIVPWQPNTDSSNICDNLAHPFMTTTQQAHI